jgi:hypothetical protein
MWVPPTETWETAGPDPWLHFRLIDGAGVVDRPDSPSLTEAERRWLHVAEPSVGAALNRVEWTWSGGFPSYLPHWVEVLASGDTAPPPLGPECWTAGPFERPHQGGSADVDPKQKDARRLAISRDPSEDDLWGWTCACGALRGIEHAAIACAECGSPVTLEALPAEAVACSMLALPCRVLHPWRQHIAAAVLGLLPDELMALLRSHDPEDVYALIDDAFETPLRSLERRLEMAATRLEQARLGELLHRARRDLGSSISHRDLYVTQIPVLPASLRFNGLPPGSSVLVAGPNTMRYRTLRFCIEQARAVERESAPALRASVAAGLKQAVDELFGDVDRVRPGELDSLAGLASRLWPLTRDARLASAPPGAFRVPRLRAIQPDDRSALLSARARVAFRESLPRWVETAIEASWASPEPDGAGLWLTTQAGVARVETATPAWRAPSTLEWWVERAALTRLAEHYVPLLAGVASEWDRVQAGGAQESAKTPGAEPSSEGWQSIGALLRAVRRDGARPSALVELLESRPLLTLPDDPQTAAEALRDPLEKACPGDEPNLRSARSWFASVLAGWWRGPITPEHPLGWRWLPLDEQLQAPWQRAVPPLRGRAWRSWSDVEAATRPVRWLLRRPPHPGPALSALLGLPAPAPRSAQRTANAEAEAAPRVDHAANASLELMQPTAAPSPSSRSRRSR